MFVFDFSCVGIFLLLPAFLVNIKLLTLRITGCIVCILHVSVSTAGGRQKRWSESFSWTHRSTSIELDGAGKTAYNERDGFSFEVAVKIRARWEFG